MSKAGDMAKNMLCEIMYFKENKIMEFLVFNNELFHEFFPEIEYFIEDDKSDIYSWEDRYVISVLWKIKDNLYFAINSNCHITDEDICPFCIYQDLISDKCINCSYGKDHGICNNTNSIYGKIIIKLQRSIFSLLSKEDIGYLHRRIFDELDEMKYGQNSNVLKEFNNCYTPGEVAKNACILLMRFKQKALKEKYPQHSKIIDEYFTEEDKENIIAERDDKVINAVRELKVGSERTLCPFCMMYNNCTDCLYGFYHGLCVLDNSDFLKLIRTLRDGIHDALGGDNLNKIKTFLEYTKKRIKELEQKER